MSSSNNNKKLVKSSNGTDDLVSELMLQVRFLSDELEAKTMELSNKQEMLIQFSALERDASMKKELFNSEALRLKQENVELEERIRGLQREKKEIVTIYEDRKKADEATIESLNKRIHASNKQMKYNAGKADLEDDIRQLHSTIEAKEQVVQIITQEQNELKTDNIRLQKQLQEAKRDNVEIFQQSLFSKEDFDRQIEILQRSHQTECATYQQEIDQLIERIRIISSSIPSQIKSESDVCSIASKSQSELEIDSTNQLEQGSITDAATELAVDARDEEIKELKQIIEDLKLQNEILAGKSAKDAKEFKSSFKEVIDEKNKMANTISALEKQLKESKSISVATGDQSQKPSLENTNKTANIIQIQPQSQQLQQPQQQKQPPPTQLKNFLGISLGMIGVGSSNSNNNPNTQDNNQVKKEKRILEALSQRVNDLELTNSVLKAQLLDLTSQSQTYEKIIRKRTQEFLSLVKSVQKEFAKPNEISTTDLDHQKFKQNIPDFSGHTAEDLLELLGEVFTENLKMKQQMREIIMVSENANRIRAQ